MKLILTLALLLQGCAALPEAPTDKQIEDGKGWVAYRKAYRDVALERDLNRP